MSTVTVSKAAENTFKNFLKQKAEDTMSMLLSKYFGTMLEKMPIEDGHAHQAYLTALEELSGFFFSKRDLASVYRTHRSKGSGDHKAIMAGRGFVDWVGKKLEVRVECNLPFVRKLNEGQTIWPGDEAGRKGIKVSTAEGYAAKRQAGEKGELYGPRLSANSRKGVPRGMLVFFSQKAGKVVVKPYETPTRYDFHGQAVAAVKAAAK